MQRATRSNRAGFSLAELLVVMAIMAVLAGVVAPIASRALVSEARKATNAELDALAQAVSEYFEDTWALPTALDDLVTDPGATGWAGPYLLSSTPTGGGLSDAASDAWDRAYQLAPSGTSVLVITSSGEDPTFGNASDIIRTVDVTPIRRDHTLTQLVRLNQAITLYNASFLPGAPLSTNYATLLATLVSQGFLPTTTGYTVDGWGDAFVPVPLGASPVVQVGSTNMGA